MSGPTTKAGKALLDDIAPSLNPSRCPVSGGEHEPRGGLCWCGWAYNRTGVAGRRRTGTPEERLAGIVAIEAEVRTSVLHALEAAVGALSAMDYGLFSGELVDGWTVHRRAVLAEIRRSMAVSPDLEEVLG